MPIYRLTQKAIMADALRMPGFRFQADGPPAPHWKLEEPEPEPEPEENHAAPGTEENPDQEPSD